MKCGVLYLTKRGRGLGERICANLPGASLHGCSDGRLSSVAAAMWKESDAIVFIMAAGIVVRTIAPLLEHKHSDPAVVVCDEKGKYAISLLSGHVGGANSLTKEVAKITGGQAVITTASDVLGHTPIDLWAKELGIVFESPKSLTSLMGRLVNRGKISVFSTLPLPSLPEDMQRAESIETADLVIGFKDRKAYKELRQNCCLAFAPVLCAGIGCNRGACADSIEKALSDTCNGHGLSVHSVSRIASIDIKSDEAGLMEFAQRKGAELLFFSKDELNGVQGVESSEAVFKATGSKAVAEPAAILGARNGKLIVRKMKWKDVTTALALDASMWWV